MKTSPNSTSFSPTKYLIAFVHQFRTISPYALGLCVFFIIYFRMCTSESDIIGNKNFQQGNFQTALKYYNDYLNLNPHDIKTLYNRGRCYDALGFTEKAALDYEAVLDRDPDNVKALLSFSQYYYNRQKYKAAINLCNSATMIDKENYLAHYYKARALHKYGDVLRALDAYNTVIELNPDYGFAYFQRSSLMISIGLRPYGCYDLQVADSLHVEGARAAYLKYCR